MPKEYVNSKYYGKTYPVKVNDIEVERRPIEETRVRVGWSKEAEHVEIATVAPDHHELEPTPEGNGWFMQLDRHGINQLIRVLRRARDQAYGADA